MYNRDTELLFPPRIIPSLRNLRGETWQALVDLIISSAETSVERLAFILLMVRLNGCISCNADAYRAMNGCTQCARQSVRRFRGSDQELSEMYQSARSDMQQYLQKKI